jgi:predicted site-specific integrase-resolvase
MRVVGYARVSTGKQAKGDSLAAQRTLMREWAEDEGHEVVAIHDDPAKSGKLAETDRPGLLAALNAIEEGEASALVVQRIDRLARAFHVQEAVLARVWACEADVWEAVGSQLVLRDDPDDPSRTFMRQALGLRMSGSPWNFGGDPHLTITP